MIEFNGKFCDFAGLEYGFRKALVVKLKKEETWLCFVISCISILNRYKFRNCKI